MKSTEQVPFRLFAMPCCGHHVCWVNPRLPNYCPECGKPVLLALREKRETILLNDPKALLTVHSDGG